MPSVTSLGSSLAIITLAGAAGGGRLWCSLFAGHVGNSSGGSGAGSSLKNGLPSASDAVIRRLGHGARR